MPEEKTQEQHVAEIHQALCKNERARRDLVDSTRGLYDTAEMHGINKKAMRQAVKRTLETERQKMERQHLEKLVASYEQVIEGEQLRLDFPAWEPAAVADVSPELAAVLAEPLEDPVRATFERIRGREVARV